jgi:bifunctional pyridoxal-dependent enzyme with beta-cystathionase and maltose regulon repressor activities
LGNGAAFGGQRFVRLTFGCPRSILEEALQKMASVLSAS